MASEPKKADEKKPAPPSYGLEMWDQVEYIRKSTDENKAIVASWRTFLTTFSTSLGSFQYSFEHAVQRMRKEIPLESEDHPDQNKTVRKAFDIFTDKASAISDQLSKLCDEFFKCDILEKTVIAEQDYQMKTNKTLGECEKVWRDLTEAQDGLDGNRDSYNRNMQKLDTYLNASALSGKYVLIFDQTED